MTIESICSVEILNLELAPRNFCCGNNIGMRWNIKDFSLAVGKTNITSFCKLIPSRQTTCSGFQSIFSYELFKTPNLSTKKMQYSLNNARQVETLNMKPSPHPLRQCIFDRSRDQRQPGSFLCRGETLGTRLVQLLFTWNLCPLQSSKLSFEHLLLPP